MKTMKKHLCGTLALIVTLFAVLGNMPAAALAAEMDGAELFTARDYEIGWDESESVSIALEGDTASCADSAVAVDGGTVTVTAEGTYILSGRLNGMVIVDIDKQDKVQLVLDGADIYSESSAAVYVRQADKVFLTLAAGSENTLSAGDAFADIDENSIDAAVFSKEDLTMNGEGTLTIVSPAGHGVVSKDDLAVTSGSYDITAAGHGLSGKDSVKISGGSFAVVSGKDGLHAENNDDTALGFVYLSGGTFSIAAEGDGVSASGALQIEDGDFTIVSGGGSANAQPHAQGFEDWGGGKGGGMMNNMFASAEAVTTAASAADAPIASTLSAGAETDAAATATEDAENSAAAGADTAADDTTSTKGVKADGDILLNGGTFSIDAADDAVHSNSTVTVNGGDYTIATGDDGIHADTETSVTGGTITITQSYEGIEGQTVNISGGTIMLTASDDGLNAAGGNDQSGFGAFGAPEGGGFATGSGSLTVSGGTLHVNAEGDGLDSNGSLTVTGGEVYVSGPVASGNSALDCDGAATVTGGTVIAIGPSQMAQGFGTASTQGSIFVSTGAQAAGSAIELTGSDGKSLLSWEADKSFDSVIVSCPDIVQGETYTLTAGSYTADITMDSLVYGGAMGGMMGGRGGR